ncbi:MAG TPA: hypothetical protein PLB41_15410 [Rubrivivax sp.]|nr:hypothetical protein [Rubrivivax sp.]HPO19891.1 hypothetical protein [Rubrivivax sp.]
MRRLGAVFVRCRRRVCAPRVVTQRGLQILEPEAQRPAVALGDAAQRSFLQLGRRCQRVERLVRAAGHGAQHVLVVADAARRRGQRQAAHHVQRGIVQPPMPRHGDPHAFDVHPEHGVGSCLLRHAASVGFVRVRPRLVPVQAPDLLPFVGEVIGAHQAA